MLNGALLVEEGSASRGLKVDGALSICGSAVESTNHILFTYETARQTWALSDIPSPCNLFDVFSIFANFNHLLSVYRSTLIPLNIRRSISWVIWNIWKSINKWIFEGVHMMQVFMSGEVVQNMTCGLLRKTEREEYENNIFCLQTNRKVWSPPREWLVKCNINVP